MGDWQMKLMEADDNPTRLLEGLVQGAGLTAAPRLELI
jgi:hypothetical protein